MKIWLNLFDEIIFFGVCYQSRYGHAKVVDCILSQKECDANATNKFGMVPLHHAAVNGDPSVIEALVKGGAKVHKWD